MTTTEPTTEPVRFTTETERMLALSVAHLLERERTMLFTLGALLRRCEPLFADDPALHGYLHNALYSEHITKADGTVMAKNCQAKSAPVPGHWIEKMATEGRSLAQVAGGRTRAAEVLSSL